MLSGRIRKKFSGMALVEFAMVAPLLIFLTVVVFDLGLVVYDKVAVIAAAREGGRTAAVTDDAWKGVQACYSMASRAGLQSGSVSCTVSKQGDFYVSQATCRHAMVVPGLPMLLGGDRWTEITVTGKALFRAETAVSP
ncbi:TadE-like protein [Thermanaeromonas toyohensis ToBE]|uniref:TadE-like protein n=1 Tax=Thermanaeromonas toyohensis ToBE TaxID=698762 RepID=A0A1W1VT10_9FIRM|nr:TadE family protein [Thermanaeromonas toyohensis]SMB96489.1 TadE-like protein [Thermanaeromonas toyohensis ToBE]